MDTLAYVKVFQGGPGVPSLTLDEEFYTWNSGSVRFTFVQEREGWRKLDWTGR